MKNYKLISIAIIFLSLLGTLLMSKKTLKRYMPATLFMAIFVTLESLVARKFTWWWFYKKLHPRLIGEIPLIWGPFFLGSLFVLRMTYGNFFAYIALNTGFHLFFVGPGLNFMEKRGISSLVRISRTQLFGLFFMKSMIMYSVQSLVESIRKKRFEERIEVERSVE
ncbi:hypothetical protein [Bacillus sp. FJAT-45037]|uniref:hypothetical protein n=1 Tax=Bacillus sp. FJAT-45037 TaxID=2011007 RepID=UPI000C243ECF|nr:hypothetical protein [Bacillus sp. FJAT-45037]